MWLLVQATHHDAVVLEAVAGKVTLVVGIAKLCKHEHAAAVEAIGAILTAGAKRNVSLSQFNDLGKDAEERVKKDTSQGLLRGISKQSLLIQENFRKFKTYVAAHGLDDLLTPLDAAETVDRLTKRPQDAIFSVLMEVSFPPSSSLENYLDAVNYASAQFSNKLAEACQELKTSMGGTPENPSGAFAWREQVPEPHTLQTIFDMGASLFSSFKFSEIKKLLDGLEKAT